MREVFEFYCSGGCGGYTIIHLDPEVDQKVIFVCPQCKHEHYRVMKDGKITESRHSVQQENALVHRVEPTSAAYSKTARLGKLQQERGFLGDLWGRMAGQ